MLVNARIGCWRLSGSLSCRKMQDDMNSSAQGKTKAMVSELRKLTGLGLQACYTALRKSDFDMEKASALLEKDLVAFAEKLKHRETRHGLIGIAHRGRSAVMAEIQCESDFVTRNQEFQSSLREATLDFLDHVSKDTEHCNSVKHNVYKNDSIPDLVVRKAILASGRTQEKVCFSEVHHLVVPENHVLATYGHGSVSGTTDDGFRFGMYGTVLYLVPRPVVTQPSSGYASLAHKLAGHVTAVKCELIRGERADQSPTKTDPEDDSQSSLPLYHQTYLFDSSKTVGQILEENGVLKLGFIRLHAVTGKALALFE